MFNLIKNEQMKIYKRVGTWVMLGILVFIVCLWAGLDKSSKNDEQLVEDWKEVLQSEIEMNREILEHNENNEDFEKRYYEQQIAINEYRIAYDLNPYAGTTAWSFVEETSMLVSLVTLFTVIIGASIVSSEFSWGTIKLLLIRPVSRSKILASKLITTYLFAATTVSLLFIVSFLVGLVVFGLNGMWETHIVYLDGQVVEKSMLIYLIEQYLLACVSLVMIVSIAFMISTLFKNSAMAIGISMFLLFTGNIITVVLSEYEWSKYILFANLDLTQYSNGTTLMEGMSMSFSLIVDAVYLLVFLSLSWYVFTKKDIVS